MSHRPPILMKLFGIFPQSPYVLTHEDLFTCLIKSTRLDLPGSTGAEAGSFRSESHCTI